jgi:Domain of unknown function (DUF4139)/N-terminal domain of unknown function (DUF4140)
MMRFLFVGILCATPMFGSLRAEEAAPDPKPTPSRIVHVTVYRNNALVTREVDIPEGIGTQELYVNPLPPQTMNNSLYSEGVDGIRVLTTRFRTRAIKEDAREEVRKIEAQLKSLAADAQKLEADAKTIEANQQLIAKLEGFTAVVTASATEKAHLNSEATIALAKYLMTTRNDLSKDLVLVHQHQQSNKEQSEFATRQLRELAGHAVKTERDAVIVVDKKNAAAGKIRFNYLVDSAHWHPQYKLHGTSKDKEPVQLEYLAAIVQQTGEDWRNVDLVLSTAQPMLNAAPPDLKTLEFTLVHRVPTPPQMPGQAANPYAAYSANPVGNVNEQAKLLRGQAQSEFNRKRASTANTLYNEAATLLQSADLLQPRDMLEARNGSKPGATAFDEGPTITYHLAGKLSVPSRQDEQVMEVARLEMAPEYYYKAVPVLTPHVYRLAELTNKTQYVLLPGEATMYQGSDFVGRMDLPLVAIGEQFTVGFGVDPQLQVHRELLDKSRTTQGGNQVLKYEYRILISSYKTAAVKLQLWDRLPRAENETAGVNLVKATPAISTDPLYLREQRPGNLLRWDLTIEPNHNGEKAVAVSYEFKLELDKQLVIGNLLSK